MKKIFLLLLFVTILTGCNVEDINSLFDGSQSSESTDTTEPDVVESPEECSNDLSGWTITFCDEFDGSGTNLDSNGLNLDKWGYQLGTGSQYGLDSWGNGEAQYYQKDNLEVTDGKLIISAEKESYGGKDYTSGRIYTYGNFAQTYGRFEARIKLPVGDGFWPAFWLLPEDNVYGGWPKSGEIDIMEARGRLPEEISGAIHYGYEWPDNQFTSDHFNLLNDQTIDEYHTYAIEWEEGEIRWYVDGIEYFKTTDTTWFSPGNPNPAPFDQDFHIILNLAIGGHFDGYRLPGDDLLPSTMEVDYVRVYQKDTATN